MYSRFTLLRQRCFDENLEGLWEESQHWWIGHTYEQDMYWRGLFAVASNACYIGIYGEHIQYDSSFEFINRYAGYGNKPIRTPGAWVAFVKNNVVSNGIGYFMTISNPQVGTYIENVNLNAKEGAYGFKINNGNTLAVKLDTVFVNHHLNKDVEVTVTWYSNGSTFEILGLGKLTGNTGKYQKVTFNTKLDFELLNVKALTENTILHMIEIKFK